MYIWVGIDVDSQLCEMRERAAAVERKLGMEISCYTLPMHISLKMSFAADAADAKAIIGDLERYFASQKPFEIPVRGIEREGAIVWIRMCQAPELDRVHDELNAMLSERYGIGLHEYDMDYKFHTTLFMGGDEARLADAASRVADVYLPEKLVASRFVIGTSNTGALGTYSVYKTVCV